MCCITKCIGICIINCYSYYCLCSNDDIVDGDVDQLDKESNETHQCKSNSCGNCNLLKLLSVWLCASLDQSD